MDTLKKYANWIIVALLCLNLFTCTNTCTSARSERKAQKELVIRDSIVNAKIKTIDSLKHEIDLREEKILGLEQTIRTQGEAMNQIVEARKNISVTVKQKK